MLLKKVEGLSQAPAYVQKAMDTTPDRFIKISDEHNDYIVRLWIGSNKQAVITLTVQGFSEVYYYRTGGNGYCKEYHALEVFLVSFLPAQAAQHRHGLQRLAQNFDQFQVGGNYHTVHRGTLIQLAEVYADE